MRLRTCFTALTALALSAVPLVAQPTSITFFGDSYTDTGNGDIIAGLLGLGDLTPTPPYAVGRASNGLVWADYLAAAFGHPFDAAPSLTGLGRNFAVGTARTGLTGGGGLPIGMLSQLNAYAGSGQLPDPTGLYVLYGGGTDVFDAALLASPAQRLAALDAATSNLAFMAQQLYAAGARSFLIPSAGNAGLTPNGLSQGPAASALLGQLSAQYNTLLAAKIGLLQASLPGSNVLGLRLDNLYHNILVDIANGGPTYGLTNATIPCFLNVPGTSCNTSVFVDDLHPTTQVHNLIAQAAINRIIAGQDVALVTPEPATVVLVAGGLFALGAVTRRRRAASL